MSFRCLAAGIGITLLLAGCGDEAEAPVAAPSRPVKLFTASGTGEALIRNFPGLVQAAQRAQLSFRISGRLTEVPVKEGDLVEAGELVARIDPADYRIALEDAEARYENARRNFERAEELVGDGYISQIDFDRTEAEFRSASAARSQARQNLDYTELHAPFPGRIAERMVDNFEEVAAKEPVVALQNLDSLEVVINVPESLVRRVPREARDVVSLAAAGYSQETRAFASFDEKPDTRFPLRIREIGTRADPQTQSFRVTFSMASPEDFRVLPGMTTTVTADFSAVIPESDAQWVPLSAVQADNGLEPRVWVYDPGSGTVSSRPVSVGRIEGERIEVLSGLEGGEEIVAVGASYLAEQMRVRPMATREQARQNSGEQAGNDAP